MEFGLYTSSENNKTSVYNFGGLNRTRRGGRSEFSDMHNMSAKEYPFLVSKHIIKFKIYSS